MATNRETPSGQNDVQVFELTMDNDENQDELNRRLRKPGEAEPCGAVKPRNAANGLPAATKTTPQRQEPV